MIHCHPIPSEKFIKKRVPVYFSQIHRDALLILGTRYHPAWTQPPRREDRDSAGSKKTRPHAVGTSLKTVSRYHPAWTHRRIPLGPDHEGQSGKFTPALGALFQFQLPGPCPSDSFTRKPFQPVGFPLWSRENDESTGSGSSPLSLFICW
ncbi:hypothetical protein HMPREF7215_1918 [Pyramidobacter piscolens W5455]|uniref:Uncharacterized protein n=1 Tax=Pyramidobacter piscolens W5455 TaxID=352165 RepID=A0ABM9ZYJ9_9BACT|nr:hypothetical protein HMPREF7215_1918 [Pyramidobacter piscolens W5455]